MEQILLYPIFIPLLTSVLLLFFWRKTEWQKIIGFAGSIFTLIASVLLFSTVWKDGIQVVHSGDWQAPFGITFVGDMLAATLVLLTSVSGLLVGIYANAGIGKRRMDYGFFPIFHFLILGLNGTFLTGDIFNLYVWFEIIIISSFVLLTLGGQKNQLEGAMKYFTLNSLASVFFLTAIAMVYGLTGSLNMADISIKMAQVENQNLVDVTAVLFLLGFGIKAAVFPFYFWLPASYHTPPAAVSAIFGGLLTKVGVYALIRSFTLMFEFNETIQIVLVILAIGSMIAGALGTFVQKNIVKALSYLIICHIGYLILGLSLFTKAAIAATIFYLIHDIMVKSNLFLIAGFMGRLKGTFQLPEMGGIYSKYPIYSFVIILAFFSLAGVPPLSGFWPKMALIVESYNTSNYVAVGSIIFVSITTLLIVAKIWSQAFWKKKPEVQTEEKIIRFEELKPFNRVQIVVPILIFTAISLYIGFGAEHIQQLALRISEEVLNKDLYRISILE